MKKRALRKLSIITVIAALCCWGMLLSSCGDQPQNNGEDQLIPISVCLDWTPNINHAGLYVAQHEGYFTQQGLDVSIVQPGDNYALQLVAAGQSQFGISYQEEVTFARAQDIPVVSLAAIMQNNTSCFAAPQSKGITSTADFAGRIYGGWGGQVEDAILSYLEQRDNYQQPVQIINIGSSDFFAATADGQVDFSWIYYGVTGIEAQLREEALDLIWVKDIDPALNYYTPVLVGEESWLADNGDIAAKFMTAVSQGYQLAASQPQKAADIILAEVPELAEDLTRNGLDWAAAQYIDQAPYWGYQQSETWQGFADWLYQQGLLDSEFDGDAAFTNEYLPQ